MDEKSLEILMLTSIIGFIGLLILGLCWVISKRYYRQSWEIVPRSTAILVQYPPSNRRTPDVLEIQTYLRMAEISYEIVEANSSSSIACSFSMDKLFTLFPEIIDIAQRKFNMNQIYSPGELAIARSIRVMLESRFYWYETDEFSPKRLLFHGLNFCNKCFNLAKGLGEVVQGTYNYCSKEIILETLEQDLKAISEILGAKLYILGDEPCEYDATIFGRISQAVWPDIDRVSPFEELFNGEELSNLKSYCIRMKDKFWPDWDLILLSNSSCKGLKLQLHHKIKEVIQIPKSQ